MKRALICGVSGQDGAYLAQLLLQQGYEVCGTSRDAQMSSFQNLVSLGIRDRVKLASMALTDFRSVLQVLSKFQPDEVYNLAGQSSVGLSFEQPVETLESSGIGLASTCGCGSKFAATDGFSHRQRKPAQGTSPIGLASKVSNARCCQNDD